MIRARTRILRREGAGGIKGWAGYDQKLVPCISLPESLKGSGRNTGRSDRVRKKKNEIADSKRGRGEGLLAWFQRE